MPYAEAPWEVDVDHVERAYRLMTTIFDGIRERFCAGAEPAGTEAADVSQDKSGDLDLPGCPHVEHVKTTKIARRMVCKGTPSETPH